MSSRQPSSEDPAVISVSLDTHVHIEDERGYEGALNNKFLGHSFLISSSYNINSSKNFSERSLRDQKVSKIVSTYPLQFSGLCGVNLSWPDASDIVKKCLAMPGMIGVKIHDLEESDSLTEKDKFKVLQSVVAEMKSHNSVLLWHIRSNTGMDKNKYVREIKEIVSNAVLNSNIYFILAHAVDSLDSTLHLRTVVNEMKRLKVRPNNLFIELSGTMDICENEPQKEKLLAWKDFGFEYILLGSDSSSTAWPGQALLEEEISVIKNNVIFGPYRKNILIKNGLTLLQKVNPTAYQALADKVSKKTFTLEELTSHSCESLRDLVQSLMSH